MGRFKTELVLKHMDGKVWEVTEPLVFEVGKKGSGELITVRPGFLTDIASIPWWARPLIGPKAGKYAKAAVLHDWLYQHPEDGVDEARERDVVDPLFLEAMVAVAITWWRRSTMYFSVKFGGGGVWSEYRAKDPIPMPD